MAWKNVSVRYEGKVDSFVPHVMNVMAERHPMVLHFSFFDQFTALRGSFGPSQSTILGSLASVGCADIPSSNSTFSISLAYSSLLGLVSENCVFDSLSSPLKPGLDSVDRKEAEDDGRSGMFPLVFPGVMALSCSLSCASKLWFVDEVFWSCGEPATKREHSIVSRRSTVDGSSEWW